MTTPANYLDWGFIVISVPNLALIVVMIAIFVAACWLRSMQSAGAAGDRRNERTSNTPTRSR
jgi:hypothetical protein